MTMPNEIHELTESDLEIVAGGFGGLLAKAVQGKGKDEGPTETFTLVYGAVQVQYSQQ
jgi:hypothetical protein